jgi:histidyl-tRNA synthetase
MSAGALPGFRDFFPSELAERAHIMRAWRRIAGRYAFVEYDGPPLEPLDLYTKKSGEEIVGQLYNFEDKGGREVALRPEMTPTFARMVASRANALRKPVRWFSMPQLFRYERQQRGRLREHYQLNVDIVGEADVTADAELLAVAIDIMRDFGLTREDVVARVSDRRLLAALVRGAGVPEEKLHDVYQAIDKIEREPRERFVERFEQAGLEPTAAETVYRMVREWSFEELRQAHRGTTDAAIAEAFERLDRYRGYLQALNVAEWVKFDLTIVRGLAYYTGIVFELFDAKGEFRAICGGGRYDDLLKSLGGVDLPALGFGMGDVVLRELLAARGLMPPVEQALDFWVAADETELTPMVMGIATLLRRLDYRVEYALRPQQLGKQLRAAASAGVERVVILRKGQIARDETLTVKRMSDGAEENANVKAWVQGLIDEAEKRNRPPEGEGDAAPDASEYD